jgi:hypothetical protein
VVHVSLHSPGPRHLMYMSSLLYKKERTPAARTLVLSHGLPRIPFPHTWTNKAKKKSVECSGYDG